MKHVLALTLVLLASCATGPAVRGPKSSLNVPPAKVQLATADYGPAPGDDYRAQVQAAMSQLLKDPESARYRFAEPEQGWLPRYHFDARIPGEPHKYGQVFGWLVNLGVNSKNSFGGYAGEQAYVAFFSDGELRGVVQRSKYKDIFDYPMWDRIR